MWHDSYCMQGRTIHPMFYLEILFSLFPVIAAFSKFSALKELELPLNNIHDTIQIQPDMFKNLETLDLSYNRLTDEDILALGLLTNLRTLHLTGIRASLNIKMWTIILVTYDVSKCFVAPSWDKFNIIVFIGAMDGQHLIFDLNWIKYFMLIESEGYTVLKLWPRFFPLQLNWSGRNKVL